PSTSGHRPAPDCPGHHWITRDRSQPQPAVTGPFHLWFTQGASPGHGRCPTLASPRGERSPSRPADSCERVWPPDTPGGSKIQYARIAERKPKTTPDFEASTTRCSS